MNSAPFISTPSPDASGFSRRVSLATLGTAGLATLALAFTTEAGKKNSTRKKAKKKCRKQAGQCVSALAPDCAGNPDCLAKNDRCCQLAGNCDVVGFFDCILATP